jgi:RNA ligase (TIGR02306 family)
MERSLATIRKITNLEPIENADAIELATVGGWRVVTRKGTFNIGDFCVYFEIDSIPPDESKYSFLWAPKEVRPKNFKLKTKRLRGVLSQGLILPLSDFPELAEEVSCDNFKPDDGYDVTEILHIEKYDYEAVAAANLGSQGGHTGYFPSWISKTDEQRVQSYLDLIEELRGKPYYITEKVDGMSSTWFRDRDDLTKVRSASRNLLADGNEKFKFIRTKYLNMEYLEPQYIVQGEVYGPNIQNNRLEIKTNDIAIFNIKLYKDKIFDRDASLEEMQEFEQEYGIPLVPIIETGDSFNYTLDALLEMAKGKSSINSNCIKEGIVIRPQILIYSHRLQKSLSFKVINNDYLEKYSI